MLSVLSRCAKSMYPEISCFLELRSRIKMIVVSFPFRTASSRCASAFP